MKRRTVSTAWRIGRELAKAYLAGIATDGLFELYRRLRVVATGPRIHVLGYHRVVDAVAHDGPVNPTLCVSTTTLRRQMEQVRRRFEVLSLEQAMAAIAGELELERDACAITFDDGYRDVLERAHPILSELGIPATVFVPSGYAGSGRYLTHDRLYAALWEAARRGRSLCLAGQAWTRLRPLAAAAGTALADGGPSAAVEALIARAPARSLEAAARALEEDLGAPRLDRGAEVLSPDEIRALADAGWEIGAHTVGHVVLTREPPERRREELGRCKRELESWSGRPCRYFAYCNGFHSRELVGELRALGYLGAVTTCDRPNRPFGDPMRVGRKVLWEGHARGLDGSYNEALSAAHVSDLFGALGLTRPVDGDVGAEKDSA